MVIRTYCRRSKNDEGKQQFSLDVQASGCSELIARLGFAREERRDYVDDGRAGDDFHTRLGLKALIAEAQRGDMIMCRDQSRLGRDAIEVTLVIRDLVRDRGCKLYYYATGQEVLFANAIDQATTFIQGTGHQMELEAIRSRTREALRSRVRDGRIAGGSCFGYTLERKTDGSGRKYTIAVVNQEEAEIVRRIFDEFLAGHGIKTIAHRLNNEGVRPPAAGRRGSGSWASGAVRTVLLNPRYHGVYIHGRIKKVRQAGGVAYVKADPKDIITTEIPEWRIIDEPTWLAVQARFSSRGSTFPIRKGRTPKYALSGLAHCGTCSGAITSQRVRAHGGGEQRIVAYGCSRHRDRGSAVCPVTVYQSQEEVEHALIHQLQLHVLGDQVLTSLVDQIRVEIAAQMPQRKLDVTALETELATVRAEQKRLAKAIAISDEIPELMSELQQRAARIQTLEAQIATAKRTPDELAALVDRVERAVRAGFADLKNALVDHDDRRQVLLSMFPEGLTFRPERTSNGGRQVWKIEGVADLGTATAARFRLRNSSGTPPSSIESSSNSPESARSSSRFRMMSDPNGAWRNRDRADAVQAVGRATDEERGRQAGSLTRESRRSAPSAVSFRRSRRTSRAYARGSRASINRRRFGMNDFAENIRVVAGGRLRL